MRERFQIGTLDLAAAPVIDEQIAGDVPQQRTRFVTETRAAVAEQTHEGVLRQIGGGVGITQPAAQPALQPAVVLTVERIQGIGGTGGIGHAQDHGSGGALAARAG